MTRILIFAGCCAAAVLAVMTRKAAVRKKKMRLEETARIQKEAVELLHQINAFRLDYGNLDGRYISHSDETAFRRRWQSFFRRMQEIRLPTESPARRAVSEFLELFCSMHKHIEKKNERFVQDEMRRHDSFFSNIDGKSLDEQQRIAVVSDEDRTLILAGAGSGKTLTIAAKTAYLCQIQHIHPEDILLISFTNKAAAEMTTRIQDRLHIPLEATTFHKLGLGIVMQAKGFRPDVFDNLESFVRGFFENSLVKHSELIQPLTEYFAYYLDIPEDMEKCASLGELYEKERSADMETLKSKYEREQYIDETAEQNAIRKKTLRGEQVKSVEETKIANFLFLHGIAYEYERAYPFESGESARKIYRPDFYLPDYDIYIEHFGITKDGKVPWLSPVEEKKYLDGIKWKRSFHTENGTTLIETYSYYASEGILLEKLEELLLENGVIFSPLDFSAVFETVYVKKSEKYLGEFIKLCCTFIALFKSNNFQIEKLDEMQVEAHLLKNTFIAERSSLFLEVIKVILRAYQEFLAEQKAVDFSDMINDAAEAVMCGTEIHRYKYIIADEYQDTSVSRFALLKAVAEKTGAKVLCVGDDWQSIFRFAGSDISLFTEFEKLFGFAKIFRIEKTYRNSRQLVGEASRFVMQNPRQMKKSLVSDKNLEYPLVFWGYDGEPYSALELSLKKIISEFGSENSILLLGRTKYDFEIVKKSGLFKVKEKMPEAEISLLFSPKTPVRFLTVHKAKGLEADNVILLNFKNDRLGFPNQTADDTILHFVLTEAESFRFAEERRLLYVALTRTKNRTFVLTDNKNPSPFFSEFSESSSVCFISIEKNDGREKTFCPRCKTGTLLMIDKDGKKFAGCSNYPRCRYSVNDSSVLYYPRKCPDCGGFLTKRTGLHGGRFIGCSNFPYCTHTEKLKRE